MGTSQGPASAGVLAPIPVPLFHSTALHHQAAEIATVWQTTKCGNATIGKTHLAARERFFGYEFNHLGGGQFWTSGRARMAIRTRPVTFASRYP